MVNFKIGLNFRVEFTGEKTFRTGLGTEEVQKYCNTYRQYMFTKHVCERSKLILTT